MKKNLSILILLCLSIFAQAQQKNGDANGPDGSLTLPFNPALKPFYHGVASGDPLTTQVIIWTRVTPDADSTIHVNWKVATDTALKNVVASGNTTTDTSKDYTVKVDVTGLSAGTTYYYAFKAMGKWSLIGRARTAATGTVSQLRFAVVSCADYEGGFYNAYRKISQRNDLDAVIHLGDYIYEYAPKVYGDTNTHRFHLPANEASSLYDYRIRYSQYHLDAALMAAHQQHTWINVWDDHESANNSWMNGAENHNPTTQGSWNTRKANSKRAYFEWIPIRDNTKKDVYRVVKYGDLADIIMLDTRLEGRMQQPAHFDSPDTGRTMMSKTQLNWMANALKTSTAKWKVIGNQTIFSPFQLGFAAVDSATGKSAPTSIKAIRTVEDNFTDCWKGYTTQRGKIIDTLKAMGMKNVVILSGDSHSGWAFDVTKTPVLYPVATYYNLPVASPSYNPSTGAGSVAVEFCGPSISSPNFYELLGPAVCAQFQAVINQPIPTGTPLGSVNYNPHMKYVDLTHKGYYILNLASDTTKADYYYMDTIRIASNKEIFGKSVATADGSNHITKVGSTPSAGKSKQEYQAPAKPYVAPVSGIMPNGDNNIMVLQVFPNPANDLLYFQYALATPGLVAINLYDLSGRKVSNLYTGNQAIGMHRYEANVSNIAPGCYTYSIVANGNARTGKVIISK